MSGNPDFRMSRNPGIRPNASIQKYLMQKDLIQEGPSQKGPVDKSATQEGPTQKGLILHCCTRYLIF